MDIPHFPASNFYKDLFLLIWKLSWEESNLCITNSQFAYYAHPKCFPCRFPNPNHPLVVYHAQPHHPVLATLGSVVESETGLDWKGPWRSSISNPPCCGQGHLSLFRLLRAHPTWPFQGMRQPHFFWQPFPVCHHLHNNEFLPFM